MTSDLRAVFSEVMQYLYNRYITKKVISAELCEIAADLNIELLDAFLAIQLAEKHNYTRGIMQMRFGDSIPLGGKIELKAEGITAIQQDFIGNEREFNLMVINQYGDQPVAQVGTGNLTVSVSSEIPSELALALNALVVAVDSLDSLPGKVAREIGEAVLILREELAKPQPILERIGRAYNLLGSTASIAAVAQYIAPIITHLKHILAL
jgi:hypothetical protein